MTTKHERFCFDDLDKIMSGPDWEDREGNAKASAEDAEYYLGRPRILLGRKNYLAQHWEKRWEDMLARIMTKSVKPQENGAEIKTKPEEGKAEEIDALIRDVFNEVRALFSRWLRMQNLCILTGAGCSKCEGGPLGQELFERCKDILKISKIGTHAKGFYADILQTLRDLPEADHPFDFEEFLSFLSATRRCFTGGQGSFKDGFYIKPSNYPKRKRFDGLLVNELLDAIEKAISVVCNLSLSKGDELLEPACPPEKLAHLAFISKFLSRDPTLGRVRLATTNYDTLFEQAMDRLSVYYADGFIGTVNRRFQPGSFRLDVYYPGEIAEGRVRRYDRFLHVYKLHGSITWRRSITSVNDPFGISCDNSPFPSFEKIVGQQARLRDVLTDPVTGNHIGLGILPTSAKYGETLTMPFSHLFRAFANAVMEPQTVCFVIGYSGWDLHINRLIEDALASHSFTLVIIDPGIKPKKWASLMLTSDRSDRVYWFGEDWARFERFVHELLPDVEQMNTERDVAKQLKEIQRSRIPNGLTNQGG